MDARSLRVLCRTQHVRQKHLDAGDRIWHGAHSHCGFTAGRRKKNPSLPNHEEQAQELGCIAPSWLA
eukprot:751618-Amphidinium_carterae.1